MIRTPSGLAAAAVAGVLVLVPATAAVAKGHGSHGHGPSHASGKHHGKPAAKKFTATGHVVSVDGDQLTVDDKGGSRDLHGTTVVVTVPDDAKVNRDDEAADLSELQPGDHVMVNGTRGDSGLVARHVNADTTDDSEDAETAEADDDASDDATDDTADSSTTDDSTDDGADDTSGVTATA